MVTVFLCSAQRAGTCACFVGLWGLWWERETDKGLGCFRFETWAENRLQCYRNQPHLACFADLFIDIFPPFRWWWQKADGSPTQSTPTPTPTNKIQTQISFSIYKHWGMSKFISLGYQIQERFYLGGSLSTWGPELSMPVLKRGCHSGPCHWGASRGYRIESWWTEMPSPVMQSRRWRWAPG